MVLIFIYLNGTLVRYYPTCSLRIEAAAVAVTLLVVYFNDIQGGVHINVRGPIHC